MHINAYRPSNPNFSFKESINVNTATLEQHKTLSARGAMRHLAGLFGAVPNDNPETALALTVGDEVAVNIAAIDERMAVFCCVATVKDMTPDAWIGMLSESAQWGIDGEAMRFAVIEGLVALLWSAPLPLPADVLSARVREVLDRAVVVARMIRKLKPSA